MALPGAVKRRHQFVGQVSLVGGQTAPACRQLFRQRMQLAQLRSGGIFRHAGQYALKTADNLHHQLLFLYRTGGERQRPVSLQPAVEQHDGGGERGGLGRVLQTAQQLHQHTHVFGTALQQRQALTGDRVEIHLAVRQRPQLD